MGRVPWRTCHGARAMGHIGHVLWDMCCGAHAVGHVLWGTCCGARAVEHMPWGTCCGARAAGRMLWGTCCGVHGARAVGHVLWGTRGTCWGHVLGACCRMVMGPRCRMDVCLRVVWCGAARRGAARFNLLLIAVVVVI